jgi:hypothetical protein
MVRAAFTALGNLSIEARAIEVNQKFCVLHRFAFALPVLETKNVKSDNK